MQNICGRRHLAQQAAFGQKTVVPNGKKIWYTNLICPFAGIEHILRCDEEC